MNITTYEPGFETLDALGDFDALCVFVGEDERPLRGVAGYVDWRLCGALSRVLKQEFFKGEAGDCLLLPSNGRISMPRIFVYGAGPSTQLKESIGSLMTSAADKLTRAKIRSVALEVPGGFAGGPGGPQAPGIPEQERARVVRERFVPKFKGDRVAVVAEKAVTKLLP